MASTSYHAPQPSPGHRLPDGAALFFGRDFSAPVSNIPLPSFDRGRHRALEPLHFPGIVEEYLRFCDLLRNPSKDERVILKRQALVQVLVEGQGTLSHLSGLRSAPYSLLGILKMLREVPEGEYRVARADNRPARSLLRCAIEQYQITPDNLEEVLFKLQEDLAQSEREPTEAEEALLELAKIPELQSGCNDLVELLSFSPNSDLNAFGREIGAALAAVPSFSPATLIAWVQESDDERYRAVSTGVNALCERVYQLGAVLAACQIAQRDGYAQAEFDPSRQESYRAGWNFLWNKDGAEGYHGAPPQTLNDSPGVQKLTLLCGNNMSGKSHYLKQCLYIQLWAQTFGFVPAAECNARVYDSFVYVDRAGTDTAKGLSAFGVDVNKITEGLALLGECGFFMVDELFSTTAAHDQYCLGTAVLRGARARGARTWGVTHNDDVLEHFDKDPDCGMYHFATKPQAEGRVFCTFRLTPGRDDSNSLAVGYTLGLPEEILRTARKYLEGECVPLQPPVLVPGTLAAYTDEERRALKMEIGSPRRVAGFTDEVRVQASREGRWLESRYGGVLCGPDKSPPHQQREQFPSPAQLLSRDDEIRAQRDFPNFPTPDPRWAHGDYLGGFIFQGASTDSSEVLERQKMFEELRVGARYEKLDWLADDLSYWLWDIGFGGRCEMVNRPLAELPMGIAYEAHGSYSGKAVRPLLELFDATVRTICMASGVDVAPFELEGFREKARRLTHLDTELRALQLPTYISEEEAVEPALAARIAVGRDITAQLWSLSKSEPSADSFLTPLGVAFEMMHEIGTKCREQLPVTTVWDIPEDRLAKISSMLAGPIRDAYSLYDGEGMSWVRRFFHLTSPADPVSEFVAALRERDSVYLSQLANYFEGLCDVQRGPFRSGRAVLEELRKVAPVSQEKWRRVTPSADPSQRHLIAVELRKFAALLAIARGIDRHAFCKVEFTTNPEITIEEGFHLRHARDGQQPNSTRLDATARVDLLSGSNMSGKTFDLKKDTLLLLCAQATGFAPAKRVCMPMLTKVQYLDRVTYDLDNDLSSFGNEVNFLLEILKTPAGALVACSIDELFSTVSPCYQDALAYGVTEYLARRGVWVRMSAHNHGFISAFAETNPKITRVHHFETRVGEGGDFQFLHKKVVGHALSQGIVVARRLGLPDDICRVAELLEAA